jgi:hypothetical protein
MLCPIVSATELLTRAVAAEDPPTPERRSHHRVAHQKVQIRRGKQVIVRDFEWELESPLRQQRWEMLPNLLAWNTPMTASGFTNWQNTLREKKDTVKHVGQMLTLDVATEKDRIKEASMVVRADDFHPVEQHLRFADDGQLDFTELAFRIGDEPQPQLAPGPHAAPPALRPLGLVPPPQADLNEAELQLRYVLFVNRWDLPGPMAASPFSWRKGKRVATSVESEAADVAASFLSASVGDGSPGTVNDFFPPAPHTRDNRFSACSGSRTWRRKQRLS